MVDMKLVLENESCVELLEFLAQNALTVAYTWFQKKRLHLQTWQHPCSMLWHCKDCANVRRQLLYLVSDCQAIHSVVYYSDDKLVCLTYNLPLPLVKRQPRRRTTQCFAVDDHISAVGSSVDDAVLASSTHSAYRQALQGHRVEWLIESSTEDEWNLLKSTLVQSAETAVGRARHRQPDRFLNSASTLEPALAHRNDFYRRCVVSRSRADHEAIAKARRYSRLAV